MHFPSDTVSLIALVSRSGMPLTAMSQSTELVAVVGGVASWVLTLASTDSFEYNHSLEYKSSYYEYSVLHCDLDGPDRGLVSTYR